ncbi:MULTISPECIES: PHB depolymerase family esterase [unclassified Rhizobium]|uniref:extracellular catalytic domain type 1 short-chain-length polyhydroxyalkanoate depolymerase n=1 Tax=unclassified Rhizobium TaxID=2613769 RepID=UPI00161A0093|nr:MULTISPECIES: PHB depolymerase family esterase [unclassified Rhizobium]MBB3545111.1 poly(hydroxyalkanoate) depolymerase family esterase [Rhizobium sp. BK399]MCS3743870.1 poly(hydroxyalkanoate) depolymerase family esterase [Rhizobium sp. BK661]MCS4095964.1 poly(hydroxyalkanoate) depolymerase family esterase [Rhizobium sp. BK176]
MNEDFLASMRRATLSTRAFNLAEATRVIQVALAGPPAFGTHGTADPDITPAPSKGRSKPFPIDPAAEVIEPTKGLSGAATSQRLRKPLGEVLRILREGRSASSAFGSMSGSTPPDMAKHGPYPAVADGAQFLIRSFTGAAGRREYKLYIPASAHDQPRGLVVMLHGCKQDPDGFAVGTRMNDIAEAHGLLVAYPGQTGAHNASSCWNWFRPTDQMRGAGEPAIIAGITAELMSEFNLDRGRVFVAGLSAGGAMAAVMGETYPDLYAAVGIHSGLPYGSANDVMSAFSVMRGDAGFISRPERSARPMELVRTIVFQGSADRTVHPSNAKRIVTAATPAGSTTQTQTGRSAGGRTYTRTIVADPNGVSTVEHWLVEGAGHAWSGGHGSGSYTDSYGPDASAEMVRFFLEHLRLRRN